MPFSAATDEQGPYLLVRGTGDAHLAHLCGLAELGARVAAAKGFKRALIDLLDVTPHLSFTEHLQLGAHVATAFRPLERVATVVPARERNGTSEKAAQKYGLALKTFTELEPAKAWLLQGPDAG